MMGTQVFFPRLFAFITQVSLWQSGFLPASSPCMLVTGEAILLGDQGVTGNAVYPFILKRIY